MNFSDMDSEAEEEEEERRMREMENLLYSQIHHQEEFAVDAGVEEVAQEIRDIKETKNDNLISPRLTDEAVNTADSGVASLAASSPEPELVDLATSGSDSDDDGIQVLASPLPVIPGGLAKRDETVIKISDDSFSSTSSDDEPRIILENPLHNVRHSGMNSNLPAEVPSLNQRKRKVVVTEIVPSSKRRRTDLATYVAERGSSSDLSSDEESVNDTEMHLNLSGTKEETRRTVSDVMREEKDRSPNTEAEGGITVLRWTQEMHDFYDVVDEEAANFDMERHFEAMEYDPNDWRINVEDKYRTSSSGSGGGRGGSRYFLGGPSPGRRNGRGRCRNCHQTGHFADECAEPERDLVCRLCAAVNDHQTDYCSNQVCLRCGSTDGRYDRPCRRCLDATEETCRQCGVRGHLSQQCPDNWRRYHDTIDPQMASLPVRPTADCHKRASEMFCVNCGRKGHYLHHCHAYQHRNSKPLSVLKVCSYESRHKVPSWMNEELEEQSGNAMSNRKRKKLMKEMKRRRKEELRDAMREAGAAASSPKRKRKRKSSEGKHIQAHEGQFGQNWRQLQKEQGPLVEEPLTSRQKWRRSMKQQNVIAEREYLQKQFKKGESKSCHKSENRLKAEALKLEFKLRRGFGQMTHMVPNMEDITRRQAIRDLETELLKRRMRGQKGAGYMQTCQDVGLLVNQLKTKTKKKLSAGLKTKVSAALQALQFGGKKHKPSSLRR